MSEEQKGPYAMNDETPQGSKLYASTLEPGMVLADAQGGLWEVVGVCMQPTITARNLRTGEEQHGGQNGLMWAGFRILVPKKDA